MFEADKPKSDESLGVVQSKAGVTPRSIRKRGYHRALRRGERWALVSKSSKDSVDAFIALYYYGDFLWKPDPLLKLVGLKEQLDDERRD